MISGDKIKLGQVARNLLSNALKFTPKGGTVVLKAVSLSPIDNRRRTSSNIIRDAMPTRGLHTRLNGRRNTVSPALDNLDRQMSTDMLRIDVIDSGAGISKVHRNDRTFCTIKITF